MQIEHSLAVLIDADNCSGKNTDAIMQEINKYGSVKIKRAYGDWTRHELKAWKEYIHFHALQPIQQFAYASGKNSTDSALIIDAMDILYTANVEAFVIVSSDSDFTRLATRIKESGKIVYGIGGNQTAIAFVAACDKFIRISSIISDNQCVEQITSDVVETNSSEQCLSSNAINTNCKIDVVSVEDNDSELDTINPEKYYFIENEGVIDDDRVDGNDFVEWVSRSVKNGKINVNKKHAPIHIAGGTAILITPIIFNIYLEKNPMKRVIYGKRSSGNKISDYVKSDFEDLGLHEINGGKGVHVFNTDRERKLYAYLVSTKKLNISESDLMQIGESSLLSLFKDIQVANENR